MPRHKALIALAFLGVLISAGSVGSQDPFRARSEAESAASAIPIEAPAENSFAPRDSANDRVAEPVAVAAPLPITPSGETPTAPTSNAAPAPEPVATAPAASSIELASTQPASAIQPAPATPFATAPVVERATPALRTSTSEPAQLEEDEVPRFSVAERRMLATVPDEIEGYFDLFMYVSKSNRGPLAQRMFVFQRDADGKILPYAEWRVSTGREKLEIHHERAVRTTTPEGMFTLDPKRFYARYWSKTWDGAPMHYAMFYDLLNHGNQSGLAIHAAIGEQKIERLGRRDSAGCIRLAPRSAKELFYKIRSTTQGRVPAFAINERGSTDRWGKIQHDQVGSIILQDGYRAVLFVENFDGRDEVVGPVIAYTH